MDAVGRALKHAQMSLRNAMEEGLRPIGLTLPQFAVLAQLEDKPGQTNADLARNAFITAQSMQGILRNLEDFALIERVHDRDHGRRQPARLTPKGRAALARARAATRAIEARLADAIRPLTPADAIALFSRIADGVTGQQDARRRD